MATSVESATATSAQAVDDFGLSTNPSPLLRSINSLRSELWSSTRPPQPSTSPSSSANLAISSSTTPSSSDLLLELSAQSTNEKAIEEGSKKRRREDLVPVAPPSPEPIPFVLALPPRGRKQNGLHDTAQTKGQIITKETNPSTTALVVEDKAIFAFWGRLIERFLGGGAKAAEPESALLDIMEIISLYASHELEMQEAFTQLAGAFRRNKCLDLFEELINLLLQQDISEDFLVKKGVAVAFLKKDRKRESDREEEEEDDYKLEEQEDTGEEEEEDERPRAAKKRTQPTTRKRKGGQAASVPKKAKTASRRSKPRLDESDEAGRLRRSPDKWTQEEDEKLMELVEKYGVGTKKWRQIAEELGTTKNSAKCAQHWRRVLAPNIHKGSWSAAEEEKLLEGVEKYGLTQWTLVAKDISGRTDIQCRYHYMRQQNSRVFSWTIEEENILSDLVAKHGSDGTWIEISDELAESKIRRAPRTALECREHWSSMKKKRESLEEEWRQDDAKKKKK